MAKNDYYVSAVSYNSDKTHIAKLKVHKVGEDGSAKTPVEMTRPEVIELINKGKIFSTIMRNDSNSKWNLGAKLEIIQVTTDYLKTKNDKSTKDNLENLPEI
jgi:hypothetical protein